MIHHHPPHSSSPLRPTPSPGANMRFLPWISSSRRQRAEEHQRQQEEEEEEEEMVRNDDGYIMFSSDEAYDGLFDKIDDLLDFTEDEMRILSDPAPLLQPCQDQGGSLSQPPHPEPEAGAFSLLSPPPAHDDDDDMAAGLINGFHCDDFDAAELEWLSNFVEESFSPTPTAADLIDNDTGTFQMIDISNTLINNGTNRGSIIKEKEEEVLQYRTPSPVSVLEHNGITGPSNGGDGTTSASFLMFSASWSSSSSSSSSSPTSASSCSSVGSGKNNMITPFSPPEAAGMLSEKRKRTQRSRPATALPRGNIVVPPFVVAPPIPIPIPIPIPSSENAADPFNPEAEFDDAYCWESHGSLSSKMLKQQKMKKKAKVSLAAMEKENAEGQQPLGSETPVFSAAPSVRKCMHCEIQKTPQWRAGPMGPKTLCNACGVRYKSGRLFPEYRPAASPTFMASVHSNSHKKVVEMRIKATTQKVEGRPAAASMAVPVSTKACELLNYIRGAREMD